MAQFAVIDSLRQKIERLIQENVSLRKECTEGAKAQEKLRSDNRELTVKLTQAAKRIEMLELSTSLTKSDPDETKRAKARINQLMREIDRCIALINVE